MSYTPPAGNNVTLIFADAYTPPIGNAITLNFNPVAIHQADLSIDATLDDLSGIINFVISYPITVAATLDDVTGSIILNTGISITVAATLDDISASINAEFQAGVWRGTSINRQSDYIGNIPQASSQITDSFNQADPRQPIIAVATKKSESLQTQTDSGWAEVARKHIYKLMPWEKVPSKNHQALLNYSAASAKWKMLNPGWELALAINKTSGIKIHVIRQVLFEPIFIYNPGSRKHNNRLFRYGIGDLIARQTKAVWEEASPHSWIWGGWPYPPPEPPPVYVPSTLLWFYQHAENYIGGAILVFGKPCFAWPLKNSITTQIKGVTIVLHSITVKRQPDLLEIPVLSVSLKFDIASWAWGITLSLKTPEIIALLDSVNGEPREIQINLDGIYLSAIIEDTSETKVFGETSYTATGRSTLALFAYPYAPLRTRLEADNKTAAQLIDYELLNTGWTAVYHSRLEQLFTTDWLIPGGAYSYINKAPIDCIIQVAQAAGARAYADRNAKLVHIVPRYPELPWEWDTATPDKTIPFSLVRNVGKQNLTQPDYNHVIVSGQSHGVNVTATIAGTGGDITAPMVVDNLITYVNAGRERARNILCNTGKQARITLDLPLNEITGLLEPGLLVEVEEVTPWRGLVTGINVSANLGVINQQVEIERHY